MADHAPQPTLPPTPLLVGREQEQAALREALVAALAGRGSLVLIGGEAGIGKTALAEGLLGEAERSGALVLVGRCYDLTETPPYGPWVEALERAPGDDALPPLPAALLPPERDGAALPSQDAILRHARAYLAALAARRPLVVLLDDLHWADAASLDLLRFLGRGLSELPLLLLTTYRDDELGHTHPLAALLPALVREARAVRLALRPLERAALGALVAARYALAPPDAERLAAYLAGRTEGNPLFAGELLRTLEGAGTLRREGDRWVLGNLVGVPVPVLLRQVIAGRLARLGEEAQRRLVMAAIIGQEVPLALWAAVAGTDEDALLDTIEAGVQARLLTEAADGAAVRFAHALIREALYESTLAPRRRRVHLRAGEALAATTSPNPESVAYHLQQAGDPRSAEWFIRAGDRAQRVYAWVTAGERYRAALTLLEAGGVAAAQRAWLLIQLGLLQRFSNPQRGIADLDDAVRLADTSDDAALRGAARYYAGHLRGYTGDLGGLALMTEGIAALDALASAEREQFQTRLASGLLASEYNPWATYSTYLAIAGRYAEAWHMAEGMLVGLPAGTPVAERARYANAYTTLMWVHAAHGRPDDASWALTQMRAGFRNLGHHAQLALAEVVELRYIALPYRADRLTERRQLAERAEAAWARARDSLADPESPRRLPRLALLIIEGDWAEAARLAPKFQRSAFFGRMFADPAEIARLRGARSSAWAAVRQDLPDGPQASPGSRHYFKSLALQRIAAALALDVDDLPTARDWLDAHDRWLDWSGAALGQSEGQVLWARYHQHVGDLALARVHADRSLTYASEPRQPLALLAAHRTLGELATIGGQHAEAMTHLNTALALAEACAAPYERALTLLALAEHHFGTGSHDDALATLAEARTILTRLGARPALARADALAACLAKPVAPSPLPFDLTPREAEVLRLVATGLSNAGVASQLSLSHRTVEQHLRTIYSKLGVPSRTAAARLAHAHDLA